jgi:hypothetical protein
MIMLDRREMLLIALGCCAAAASGCQSEAPASATNSVNAKSSAAGPQAPLRSDSAGKASPTRPGPEAPKNSKDEISAPPASVAAAPGGGRVIPITFDDLQLEMKEDSVFDPGLLTPRVKQLDGQRVRIRGFIFPSIFQQSGITRFPLVKNTQCKFGPGGVAHHIIVVDLQPGLSTSFTVRPIAVEGRLTVRPWNGPDGKTWTVYHMAGEKVD